LKLWTQPPRGKSPQKSSNFVQFSALCLKMREPFLSETDAPPRRRSLFRKKVFFAIFYFARADFFSSKRKRKLFCGTLLLTSRAAGLRFGRRAKIPSPRPPSFLPACWKPPAIFSGGDETEKETKEVKTLAPPSRARVFGFLLPIFFTAFK